MKKLYLILTLFFATITSIHAGDELEARRNLDAKIHSKLIDNCWYNSTIFSATIAGQENRDLKSCRDHMNAIIIIIAKTPASEWYMHDGLELIFYDHYDLCVHQAKAIMGQENFHNERTKQITTYDNSRFGKLGPASTPG